MAILYCVCNRASTETCDRCRRFKTLQPDQCLNWPNWPRKTTVQTILKPAKKENENV